MLCLSERLRVLCFLAGIGIFFLWGCGSPVGGDSTEDDEDEDGETEEEPEIPILETYKGLWAPAILQDGMQSMEDSAVLLADGFNIVSIVVNSVVDPAGSIALDSTADEVTSAIDEYQEAGLGIFLALDFQYSETGDPDNPSDNAEIPASVVTNPSFLENAKDTVREFAAMAQDESVHIFSPYNEIDLKLDDETASAWGQELLSATREYFSGKVMWKGANNVSADFSGYDLIGISLSPAAVEPMSFYRTRVVQAITALQAAAASDGVGQVAVSEFGVWGPGTEEMDEETFADAYEVVLEEGVSAGVDGFFAFDGIAGMESPLRGSSAETIVADYYLNRF